jgi:RNA polymerase sigma factor (sigma-70 family)
VTPALSPQAREERILSLEPRVRRMAALTSKRVGTRIGFDELLSAAWLGAIKAVDGFDPEREKDLEIYADWKIRSAIADYTRSLDPLTRAQRRDVNAGVSPRPIFCSLSSPCMLGSLNESDHGHTAQRSVLLRNVIADPRGVAEALNCEHRLTLHSLHRRAEIRLRNARVLNLYMQGELMEDIGKAFGIMQSRVSQICTRQIEKLRQAA